MTFFLSILSAIAIASEETPDLYTESTSELAATNSTNSLKDGLESFTHTLTHPRVTGADGTVRLSRDAMGRVLKATRQDLTEIDFGYDLLGNLTGVTPPDRSTRPQGIVLRKNPERFQIRPQIPGVRREGDQNAVPDRFSRLRTTQPAGAPWNQESPGFTTNRART